MLRISNLSIVAVFLAVALLAVPSQGRAQLPPGVSVQVVQEYPDPASLFPGAKSVQQVLFILQPGAKLEDFTPSSVNVCSAVLGEAKVVIEGKTIIRKAGTMWIEKKGVPFTITNEGNVPFVDMFFKVVY